MFGHPFWQLEEGELEDGGDINSVQGEGDPERAQGRLFGTI